jgi:hypothetical protein
MGCVLGAIWTQVALCLATIPTIYVLAAPFSRHPRVDDAHYWGYGVVMTWLAVLLLLYLVRRTDIFARKNRGHTHATEWH